ncbi:hypothetical protein MUK42_37391 [Musa troglodytarum]|uniref:Uncharacterized protein n=1 Tax=Musa troglodytarum TaxID=320322 RepID=A0A9E7FMQ8_9LILI|nr:hypothetical protein MUK42_37391 [Musa troglodytarum]
MVCGFFLLLLAITGPANAQPNTRGEQLLLSKPACLPSLSSPHQRAYVSHVDIPKQCLFRS